MLSRSKILITGASGFIGQNLLKKIATRSEYEVCATYNSNMNFESCGAKRVRLDLEEGMICPSVLTSVDTVIHLAGLTITANNSPAAQAEQISRSLTLSRNFINALENSDVKKIIWLSSTTGYPNKKTSLKETDYFDGEPHARYLSVGRMYRKIETELIQRLRQAKNKNVLILRPSAVYGVGADFGAKKPHALTSLIRELVSEPLPSELFADLVEARDWIYVSDVSAAICCALTAPVANVELNIASGETISMFELYKMAIKIAGLEEFVSLYPKRVSETEPLVKSIDISRSKKFLGPYNITTLDNGIMKTFDWLASINSLGRIS